MILPFEILNQSQCKRLLHLFRVRGSQGVFVYEITNSRPEGLGIQQYNTRIKELRALKNNIVSTVPGHFVLKDYAGPIVSKKLSKKESAELKVKKKKLEFFDRVLQSGIYTPDVIAQKQNLLNEIKAIEHQEEIDFVATQNQLEIVKQELF